ncbi:MAG: hypothetical protein DI536_01125 [Archangium gephyra]|uniref:Uncharacterized protein n=1 Tax=Archangium gephyra TaxID=48 RepID=A0A2W5W5P1_9BACT|nr:MAG: hypothetical protein DI536_01125 [Archangium gephyra]
MMRIALGGIGFFLLLHLCGFREDVGFLSGTVPTTALSLLCGLAYAGSWFFAVLVTPVLLLTALTTRRWPSTPRP